MKFLSALLVGAVLVPAAVCQTFTNCNPMNATCPNDPALGTSHNFVFNTSSAVTTTFNITAGSLVYGSNGTQFTVKKKGDSPTIQSKFYIFWGSVSVIMQAATGQGIISSIVLESDDLDEVDWEFLGGNWTHAETNYFGKGNTTSYDRAIYYPLPGGADPRTGFHNYTIHWTSDQLQWYIDSTLVRTLPYAAANGGKNYPQTPMTVRLGIWAGGDSTNENGTIEWAGGLTDYTKGPYTMTVQSAQINDFSTGAEYQWADKTGSFASIKSIAGNSTAVQAISKADTAAAATATPSPSLTIAQKWEALPSTAKVGVYVGGGAAACLLIFAALFSCIRQRQKSKRDRLEYNAKVEREREEAYKNQMELREKGIGGWDEGAYATQGDDALGGWGGTHVPPGTKATDLDFPDVKKTPVTVTANEIPSRPMSPTLPRVMDPVSRITTPNIIAPKPQSPLPRQWTGGNEGGMIHNAGNPYTGGFGGVERQPSFPTMTSPAPVQRGYSGAGYPQGRGYQQGGGFQQGAGFSQGGGYSQGRPQQGGYQAGGYQSGGYQGGGVGQPRF